MSLSKSSSSRLPLLFLIFLGVPIAMMVGSWWQDAVPLIQLYRDTFVLASAPSYLGFFSNGGVFLFCMAGSVACFSALVLAADGRDLEFARFLLAFGSMTFWLMADDFFMIHEIAERRLRISDKWIFLGYAALICASLWRFRRVVSGTRYGYLLVAIGFFAVSVFFDAVLDGKEATVYLHKEGEKYLLEDGSKLLGIASWLFYFAVCSYERISAQAATVPRSSAPS